MCWDFLTHTDGWLRGALGLDFHAATGLYWWTVADVSSTIIGGLVAVWLAGRAALRTAVDEPIPVPGRDRSAVFWSSAGVGAAVGLGGVRFLPAAGDIAALGVRLLHLLALVLLVGALCARAWFGNSGKECRQILASATTAN
ncbi:DUF4184 family protein [Plantactinospora siamensis]|uniref:DUF4184 family protein n=1 Tax=Plantactinospora siamensis TaxID=555372 RepID=A0ABV6NPG6_9ACTN